VTVTGFPIFQRRSGFVPGRFFCAAAAAGKGESAMATRKTTENTMLIGGDRPQIKRVAKPAWTAAKRETFLATLESTCNISEALRQAQVCYSSFRRLRDRDAGFRAEIRSAIAAAHAALTLSALDKAMNGTVKTTTRRDGSVETVHEYPLHIAVQLLRLHKEVAVEDASPPSPQAVDAAVKSVVRKIGMLKARDAAAQAAANGGAGGAGGK
jgi:hypothetical protein